MAIVRFTREQFEAALPQKDGVKVFKYLGTLRGEHVYVWEMTTQPLRILVQSTIDHTGIAADCGEDSIRIQVQYCSEGKWLSVAKGPDSYTTRVKGWEKRLHDKIKEVFRTRIQCVRQPMKDGYAFNYVRQKTANFGRPFQTKGNEFRWLDTKN